MDDRCILGDKTSGWGHSEQQIYRKYTVDTGLDLICTGLATTSEYMQQF